MEHRERGILWLAVVAVLVLGVWGSVGADPMEATISLGREPEPPMCVANPGGVVDITWDIEHLTTPRHVYYKLEDPTRTIIYDEETYSGNTGITGARQWTVPAGAPDGKYWIRVEYWSFEAGNEANAEVTFYVCSETADLCASKYEDKNCNDILDEDDAEVENWWICIDTPQGDTFCRQTGPDGIACWTGLSLGDYTVYEILPAGWVAIYPPSLNLTLTPGDNAVTFFNKLEGASATERSTWGRLKGTFR